MSAPLICERLIECRKANGLNKVSAANLIGLTQSGYLRYENGERKPTIQVIEAMAYAFHTSVDYLQGNSDDPSADRIVVLKKEAPELFEICDNYDHLNEAMRGRLMAYYKELVKETDGSLNL